MIRIVVDTNLLVAGRWNPSSASRKIIEMCLEGAVQAVYTREIKDENLYILSKVKPPKQYLDTIMKFYNLSKLVKANKHVTASRDYSDNRFLEAALAGQAEYVVSSDRHLLELVSFRGIRILKPGDFVRQIGAMIPGWEVRQRKESREPARRKARNRGSRKRATPRRR